MTYRHWYYNPIHNERGYEVLEAYECPFCENLVDKEYDECPMCHEKLGPAEDY